jgi:hypothetical protein
MLAALGRISNESATICHDSGADRTCDVSWQWPEGQDTPLIESSSQGSTITASVALNGGRANLITFDAFQNGAGLSSLDVEGHEIEMELSNVGTIYDNSIATVCYFRLKSEPISPPSPGQSGQVSTLKEH